MITNETIRKVVINKALFPPVTEYAKRTAAGATVDFETNCEKDLSRFNIGYSYNSEDPQGITKANVVQTGANIYNPNAEIVPHSTYGFFNLCPDNTELSIELFDKDNTVSLSGISFGFSKGMTENGAQSEVNAGYNWIVQNGTDTGSRTNIRVVTCDQFFFYPKTQATLDTINARYYINIVVGSTVPTTYAPYNSTTYEIDFGTTVYGFSLAPITGTGKVRDIDGVESDFTFTPFNITTYNGINNIFLDIPDSSLAITYLVEKPTEYRYAQQFLPIFYPNGSNQERRFIT